MKYNAAGRLQNLPMAFKNVGFLGGVWGIPHPDYSNFNQHMKEVTSVPPNGIFLNADNLWMFSEDIAY